MSGVRIHQTFISGATIHAAQASSSVISGASTQNILYNINWTDREICKCCQAHGTEIDCAIAANGR